MKPKNIMLLGFVNKAVDYLEKHMDEEPDTRLAELKNIDLTSLREELSDYLDSSLGTMQSTMSTLLKAGNEAFDHFMEVNHKENISDQFSRMLDVDFDDEKKTNQEELAKLLSFYNLEDFDADNTEEIDIPQTEEIDTPQTEEVEDTKVEEFVIPEDGEFVIPQVDEEDIPEFGDINLSSEDDKYMEEIKKNITSDVIDDTLLIDEEADPAIDSIFSEIIENESKPVEIEEEQTSEVETPEIIEVAIIEEETIKLDAPEFKKAAIEEEPTKLEAPEFKEVAIEEEPTNLDATENKEDAVEEETENTDYSKVFDDLPLENPGVDEEKVEETPVEETQTYVNTLIDELREQMVKEDAIKKEEEEKEKAIFNSVHEIYPNLSQEFVMAAYGLKQPLADEYPVNQKLIILHRISFDDVDNLRKFVEIGLSHDYTINADENKLIVDILKEFVNSDGKILTNIFEVANQGSVLHGNYEGYNIISNE